MDKKEKKNRITGAYVSIGLHALLALFFFFSLAWTEPDPPIPEYGIEFNLGNELISDQADDVPVQSETIDQVEEVEDVQEAEEPSESSESSSTEEPEEPDADESAEPVEETANTEDINSPDVVEKKVEEIKKVEKKPEEAPKKEETRDGEDEVDDDKETAQPEPKINESALYKKTESGGGSGNIGASLQLDGWEWESPPNPDDYTDEEGKIVFDISIDEYGDVTRINVSSYNVSPEVLGIYRTAVLETTFRRKGDYRGSAAVYSGKITFIIQSK